MTLAYYVRQFADSTTAILHFRSIQRLLLLILALSFAHHFLLVRRKPGAPVLVKSWIPLIGTAIPFFWNPERFLFQCKELYGDVYTLYMGGKRFHVVCDPVAGFPAVYKNHKIFSMSVLFLIFGIRMFGHSEKMLNDTDYQEAIFATLVPLLLAQDKVDVLITQFNTNLRRLLAQEIKRFHCDGQVNKDGVIVNFDTWLDRIMFECSGKTLFGDTWPSEESFFQRL
jgi:hypothetical protein